MPAYESTFEIPPFPAFPSVSRYVAVGSLEDARQRISRSIDAREGLSLVIGPPGTGKSLLCALLTREYSSSYDVVTLGDTPMQDAATFYRHLLHHLGVAFDSIPEGDLQLAIVDRVRDKNATRKGLLVLVDEAQSLSADVLEAIRMTTNIMLHGQPRVYVVVCGGPKLDDTLSLPSLEPFTQRVAARCYLHPLSANETRTYISESIRHCGGAPEETISDEAMAAVHHACCGVPRLINQLVTSAIDVAADVDQNCITDSIVDRAWAELQQLPSPMIEEASLRRNSSTIEFGELDDSNSFDFASKPMSAACADACDKGCGNACDVDELSLCGGPQFEDIEISQHVELRLRDEESYDEVSAERTTAPPESLFGEYDSEEVVSLGNGFATTQPFHSGATFDIETMLHSEIIGMSSDVLNMNPLSSAEDEIYRYPNRSNGYTAQNTVQWLDEVEGGDGLRDDDSDIVIHDDSDMLVIEDEIDLRAIDTMSRIDTEEKVVSVDFQAMLSRMRHGTAKEAS